jgi:hypothetical protein
MHSQPRAEQAAEVLLGLGHAHRLSEPLERNISATLKNSSTTW